jgi:thiosulfate dehydrogenase [quinone] large subunit
MPTSPPKHQNRSKERRLPFNAPVRAWALAEWALLPLRLFLGVTFLFAGLQKLSNPTFFNNNAPNSMRSQLLGSVRTSPIHALLSHLVNFANPIGMVIAYAEIAIGIGVLLGLWTRVAAIGGAILSFNLFLTVSFHSSPYFTGADIVFFFAWMPFILAGGGTRLSADAWIANRAAKKEGVASPELVVLPFARVQELCGNFSKNTCKARRGLACDAAVCPVLLGDHPPIITRRAVDSVDRRSLVIGGTAAAIVGTTAVIFGATTADVGKLIGNAKVPASASGQLSTTTSGPASTGTTPSGASSGTLIGSAHEVPVGKPAAFTIPTSGDPGIIIQLTAGDFVGYDAVCPHMGCTVGYSPSNNKLVCPCHGSEFLAKNGDVISGPAPHGLTKLNVVEGSDGNLYLK